MSALPEQAIDAEDRAFVPMTDRDLEEVLRIETDIYPFPWTRINFADALHAGYSGWTLRTDGGVMTAYGLMMLVLDEAHLLNLSVARHAQRQGVGWRTLEWMAEVARGHSARTMLLEVRPSNAAAARLYRRYGFEQIGVRRGYYPSYDGREDAIVMRIPL
jgi:ribosomal-protein-alanine N-acetyltransferase